MTAAARPRAGAARSRLLAARELVVKSGVGPVDNVLAATVVALVGFGIVMVYSASAFEATVRFADAQHYVKRQAAYAIVALFTMWLTSRLDYARLKVLTYPALGLTIGLLGLTVAGFGHRAGNAYRWLTIGPIHVQPSEMAKVALVMWLAYSLSKKAEKVRAF